MPTVRELTTKWGFDIDLKPLEQMQRAISVAKDGIAETRKGVLSFGASLKTQVIGAGKFGLAIGALAAPITALIKSTAELGDHTAKLADSVGISTEFLQEFTFAADRGGVTAQGVSVAMLNLARRIAEAAEGTGPAAEAFDLMGVSAFNAQGEIKGIEEVLPELADGLAGIQSGAQRAQVAFDIFGKVGVKLLNVFGRGRESVAALQKEFRDLGGVMEDKLARQGETFLDASTNLGAVLRGLRFTVARELLPDSIRFIHTVTEELRRNLPDIRRRVVQFLRLSGESFKFSIDLVKGAFRIFGLLADTVERVGAALRRSQKAMLAFKIVAIGIAAVLFPIQAAIVALLLVLDDIAVFVSGKGKSVIGFVVKNARPWFEQIKKSVFDFLDNVKSRLMEFRVFRDVFEKIDEFRKGRQEAEKNRQPTKPRHPAQELLLEALDFIPGARGTAEELDKIVNPELHEKKAPQQSAPGAVPGTGGTGAGGGNTFNLDISINTDGPMTEAAARDAARMVKDALLGELKKADDQLEGAEVQ